jgi:hypothetical protein
MPNNYKDFADRVMLDDAAWQSFMRRCVVICKAGVYGHKSPETVAVAALRGMSLGLGFMESLDAVKVIHGTPQIRGAQAVALVRARLPGAQLECVTDDDKRHTEAVWNMARPGEDAKAFRVTLEDAQRAGLTKSQTWTKYTDRMLKWWAASIGCQELFGDVLSIAVESGGGGDELEAEPAPVAELEPVSDVPPPAQPQSAAIATQVVDAEVVEGDESDLPVQLQGDPAIIQFIDVSQDIEALEGGERLSMGEAVMTSDGIRVRAKSIRCDDGNRLSFEKQDGDQWHGIFFGDVIADPFELRKQAKLLGAQIVKRGVSWIEIAVSGEMGGI